MFGLCFWSAISQQPLNDALHPDPVVVLFDWSLCCFLIISSLFSPYPSWAQTLQRPSGIGSKEFHYFWSRHVRINWVTNWRIMCRGMWVGKEPGVTYLESGLELEGAWELAQPHFKLKKDWKCAFSCGCYFLLKFKTVSLDYQMKVHPTSSLANPFPSTHPSSY